MTVLRIMSGKNFKKLYGTGRKYIILNNEREKAREAALKMLDYCDRTASELNEKLKGKGFSEETAALTVAALQDCGIVNDARYAENYIQSKLGSGKGSRWITMKLREKGISANDIENAFFETGESENENILCMEKALSICNLKHMFDVDEYAEPVPSYGAEIPEEGVSWFRRKTDPDSDDRMAVKKAVEKEKASLTRKLISAGFPSGIVFETVRKIERL